MAAASQSHDYVGSPSDLDVIYVGEEHEVKAPPSAASHATVSKEERAVSVVHKSSADPRGVKRPAAASPIAGQSTVVTDAAVVNMPPPTPTPNLTTNDQILQIRELAAPPRKKFVGSEEAGVPAAQAHTPPVGSVTGPPTAVWNTPGAGQPQPGPSGNAHNPRGPVHGTHPPPSPSPAAHFAQQQVQQQAQHPQFNLQAQLQNQHQGQFYHPLTGYPHTPQVRAAHPPTPGPVTTVPQLKRTMTKEEFELSECLLRCIFFPISKK